tara:strand:+ start:159 stop:1094 length:936 start_codon:yes stop_codon:yes gene_type:complete
MIALILGLILLTFGGDLLVRHASAFAIKSNVPPLIVGLTVVSIGTSSPELFASLQAVWTGANGIAVGNVIGSNIANLGLALGLTAMIKPLVVDKSVLVRDFPMMVFVTLLFGLLAIDGQFNKVDGAILLIGLVVYIGFQIKRSKFIKKEKEIVEVKKGVNLSEKSYAYLVILMIIGCVMLYLGSESFILGASSIAKMLGVSDLIIGVTVVAFGTSVPEIVASLAAVLKGEGDLGIGNLVGSNIMNILLVLGGSSLIGNLKIDSHVINFDFWWMLGTAALLFPILKFGKNINRIEGGIYVISYVTYIYITLV